MIGAAAIAFTALMGALAVFQCALIVGAPIGHFAWGGQERVLSRGKRVGSAISIPLYALFALIVLQRAGLVAVIPWQPIVDVGAWVLVVYFALGIVMNGISRSMPERWTMAPLCAVLLVLLLVVVLG